MIYLCLLPVSSWLHLRKNMSLKVQREKEREKQSEIERKRERVRERVTSNLILAHT